MTDTGRPPDRSDRLVIRLEDLDETIPVSPAGVSAGPTGARPGPGMAPPGAGSWGPAGPLPGLRPQPAAIPIRISGGGDFLIRAGANTVISGLLAGVLGGLIGFFLAESLKNPAHLTANTEAGLQTESGLWVLIFGLGLGALLMAWDGITSRSSQKALRDGAIGALVGAVAGFLGGFIAQWLFIKLVHHALSAGSESSFKNDLLLARAIGWAVFGGLLGVGLGIKDGGKKVINGLIGGVVGGAVGGLIFQLIDNASTSSDGFVPRMIGLVATGIGIGLAIGLVERARRDSWVVIAGGPMAGKEFILYKQATRVGRDYRCDIVMAKDLAVAPLHLTFTRDQAGMVTAVANPGAMIMINGAPSAGSRLRSGDVVGVGGSSLCYQERSPMAGI
jgi:hypothetical protein